MNVKEREFEKVVRHYMQACEKAIRDNGAETSSEQNSIRISVLSGMIFEAIVEFSYEIASIKKFIQVQKEQKILDKHLPNILAALSSEEGKDKDKVDMERNGTLLQSTLAWAEREENE